MFDSPEHGRMQKTGECMLTAYEIDHCKKKLLFRTQIGEETLHMMHYVGRKSDLHFLTAACINAVKCILPWSRHASSEHAMHQRCFHRAGNSTESEAEVYCTHSSE